MRVLFATTVWLGHFLPLVPLAWAARAAGHQVLVVTAGESLTAAGAAGLPAADACPAFDTQSLFEGRQPLAPEAPEGIVALWAAMGDRMADGTVAAARAWRPELVVHEPFQAAGPLAAARLGIPAIRHNFNYTVPDGMLAGLTECMRPVYHRHGLPWPPPPPLAVIDPCPPSMRIAGTPPGVAARYVPYDGGGPLPNWLTAASDRPRVCLTMGTWVHRPAGVGLLRGFARAADSLGLEAVIAAGNADLGRLGPLPASARAASWLPVSVLLPTCAAIVHHGGAGCMFTALVAGVPQLVVPHVADHPSNAAAVHRRGAGLVLERERANDSTAREALHRLLDDEGIARAAQQVSHEIAAMPTPAAVIDQIERLAA